MYNILYINTDTAFVVLVHVREGREREKMMEGESGWDIDVHTCICTSVVLDIGKHIDTDIVSSHIL